MSIDRTDAEAIAKKLNAEIDEKKRHRFVKIFYQGRLVAGYGIPRGSKKEHGLGHVPRELGITPHQTAELAACTMTAQQYFDIVAPPEPPVPANG